MIEVLYEDNHIIAVNKKSGDIIQGDKTGDTPLSDHVKLYIKKKYDKKGEVFLGTIHRLDRPTSGVILFARTSKALARMNEQFRKHEVKKTYWAIVEHSPAKPFGTLNNKLQKNEKKNKSFVTKTENGKNAILNYKLLKRLDNFFLLEIKPKTGRHHQIRVQLSNIGCIIKGDLKYGAKRSNKDASISLIAKNITFIHPVSKKEINITAPCPKTNIWKACN